MSACRAIAPLGWVCKGGHDGEVHSSAIGSIWIDVDTWDVRAADTFVAQRVAVAQAMNKGQTCCLTEGNYLDSDGFVWGICGWKMLDPASVTGEIEFTRLNGRGRFTLVRSLLGT